MVYGDNRQFNIALVALDEENIGAWAAQQGVDVEQLAEDDRVADLIKAELETQLAGAKGYERIRKFAILPEDFTLENEMLTPTQTETQDRYRQVRRPYQQPLRGGTRLKAGFTFIR